MDIVIVEDDMSVCMILKKIIDDKKLGEIKDICTDPKDGQESIIKYNPDIVLIDLLMPNIDGITLVKECKSKRVKSSFIMISQVCSKEIIGSAYESGIEFYINKPINAIEVENVIIKVIEKVNLENKILKIEEVFGIKPNSIKETSKLESENIKRENEIIINNVMKKVGIIGEAGSSDIRNILVYIIENNIDIGAYTLKELLTKFNKNYKSLEQRIRRTCSIGLRNLANLGLEDYMNETFAEYSTSLYNFEEVKREMDYIRGKRTMGGKVNVKKFLEGMFIYCDK